MRTEPMTVPKLRHWAGRITGALGVPPEVAFDLPKTTLIGNERLQIQNHRGVVEYTSRRIRVRSREGEIVVTGTRLRIGSIFQDEMVIEGNIMHIDLPAGGALG